MFGFFKKKDKQPQEQEKNNTSTPLPKTSNRYDEDDDDDENNDDEKNRGPVNPSPKAKELITKLEDALKRIQDKATEILKDAEEKSQPFINDTLFDTQAIHQFWGAVEHKAVRSLGDKVDEKWDKFCDLTDEADLTTDDIDLQETGNLRDDTNHWLEVEYQRYYVRVLAKAAQKIWQNALQEDTVKQFACSSCGAPLDLNKQIFKAINLKCNFCSFVNSYEPADKMRMAEAFAVEPLCNEAAFEAWEKMQWIRRQAERETDGGKKSTIDTLDKWEAAALHYWNIWFKKREELVADYAPNTQSGIDNKMEWVWKDIRRMNNQWVSKR